jgi:NagD protein
MTQTTLVTREHGFLLDMDGVIYRGSELIPGADRFIAALQHHDIPFLFLTNNSQRSQLDVATKLRRMGITVDPTHVFTCALATARFLQEQMPHPTAFVIGEGGLLAALHDCGVAIVDHTPDYVIVGEGRSMNFEQIEHATRMVLAGAKLIATNLDPNCPTAQGMRPGAGAIVRMIEAATGRTALGLGKPSPVMMRMARKELGLRTAGITMVGDTMETDIIGGVQMGYRTILVLSGGTDAEDIKKFAFVPDLVVPSVATIADILQPDGSLRLDEPPAPARPVIAPAAVRPVAQEPGTGIIMRRKSA